MRGIGLVAIIVGIIAIVASMAMDVSVSTGMGGRVNNIGLMAQQQNYLVIGALITFSGVVMFCLGGRCQPAVSQADPSFDSRPCPYCAEPIKHAAVKCKHCAAEVEPAKRPPLKSGWVVSIACRPGIEFERTKAGVLAEELELAPSDGAIVMVGPYAQKSEALESLRILQTRHSIFGEIKHVS